MLFTMVALWIISIILLINDVKSINTKWAASLTFTAGIGGLSRVIKDTVIPSLLKHNMYNTNPLLLNILHDVHSVCSFIAQNFVPYTFLMFSIYYSSLFKKRTKQILAYTLLIPIVYMFYITPFPTFMPGAPEIGTPFKTIIIWVIPYILIGSVILMYSYIKENNPILKKDRALTNILAIIPMIFILFSNYIASASNFRDLFRFNAFIIMLLFISFIAFTYKYGAVGIKIRMERIGNYDETIKAINSGAGILAHSIKNELSKISICAYNIGDNENAKIILKSVNHMRDIVSNINEKIQYINLNKSPNSLNQLISESIELVSPSILDKKIDIKKFYTTDVIIECDKVHIKEVLLNILKNSIDAIEFKGSIGIQIYQNKKHTTVEISDTGAGIPKEYLKKVFEPFFSTKDRYTNYGLGLSYCYNIIYEHEGTMEIKSTEGVGTTVYLNFSNRKKDILKWIWKRKSE